MARTITSADATAVISSSDFGLATTPLADWMAEAMWVFDEVETAVTVMTADGHLTGGWVPRPYPVVFSFIGSSESIDIFDSIIALQDAQKTLYRVNMVLTLPGIGKSFTCAKGLITRAKPLGDGQRTLQGSTFQVTFESVKPVPIA